MWIRIGIMLGFLIIEKCRIGKSCIRICICGGQVDDLSRLNSGSVTSWGGWRAGQWSSRRLSRLCASVRWRCTCAFAAPACLLILCGAILARKAARQLVLTKHCRVSFNRSLHHFVPRKLNTPLLLFSDLGAWFLNEVFVSSIAPCEKPCLAILAIFNARRMSDCSSCTRPPCLAIVADMLKTYKTLVAASNNEIWLLPLPYTLLWPPLR